MGAPAIKELFEVQGKAISHGEAPDKKFAERFKAESRFYSAPEVLTF
jgi:hypothetical protein